jgi:hypothetical protein
MTNPAQTWTPPPDLATPSILDLMSAEREELRRLVEELPDEQVPAVLAEVRRRSLPEAVPEWPPSWFNSFASGRHDLLKGRSPG